MAEEIVHRGPDGDGFHLEIEGDGSSWCGMAHRRLAIVDLSDAGHQPMHSRCGRYTIAFNGEIYNFVELREQLKKLGAGHWTGHSDTEVLLELLVHHGIAKTLDLCDGMFAFALLDRSDRSLLLARDAFGEKPLVYGYCGQTLLFGSDLRSLARWPGFSPEVDVAAATTFMRVGHIPAPLTIYRGFAKLPPGSLLRISPEDIVNRELPAPEAWWDPVSCALKARDQPLHCTMSEAASQVEQTLLASVERRMGADVPLGAMLSGGIDSTLTVALMQTVSPKPVRTFTIGMDEPGYDESPHAEAVARHLGTNHRTLRLSGSDMISVVPEIAAHYDEPFADSSQIPTFLVSRLARTQVTVALSGDGGDELFAGYNRHFLSERLWRRLQSIPLPLRHLAARLLLAVPPTKWSRVLNMLGSRMPHDLGGMRAGERIHKLAGILDSMTEQDLVSRLVAEGTRSVLADPEGGGSSRHMSLLPNLDQLSLGEKIMLRDTTSYLPDDILTKVDRASMAVSLEVRTPFLDRELFKLAWSLPFDLKTNGIEGKLILRTLAYRHVPKLLLDRPKAGFALPLGRWLRGPLAIWADSLLAPSTLAQSGLFNVKTVSELWHQHLVGLRDHEKTLWPILIYESWRTRR